jgi:hypothetical protein
VQRGDEPALAITLPFDGNPASVRNGVMAAAFSYFNYF